MVYWLVIQLYGFVITFDGDIRNSMHVSVDNSQWKYAGYCDIGVSKVKIKSTMRGNAPLHWLLQWIGYWLLFCLVSLNIM